MDTSDADYVTMSEDGSPILDVTNLDIGTTEALGPGPLEENKVHLHFMIKDDEGKYIIDFILTPRCYLFLRDFIVRHDRELL